MDQGIKTKWVEALRSGKYEQGETYLRSSSNKWCCLGVLIDIQGIEVPLDTTSYTKGIIETGLRYPQTWTLAKMNDGLKIDLEFFEEAWHDNSVYEALEGEYTPPIVPHDLNKKYSFTEIADFIEEKL